MEIIVHVNINSNLETVWDCFTEPKHIVNWNFAHESWECPKAENNLEIGGEFHYLMAAKDKSMSFDFWGTYIEIIPFNKIFSVLGDGRKYEIVFNKIDKNNCEIFQKFEPEEINSLEMQEQGWQSILNEFKNYVESL